ncbi:MAG: DUF1631 family protein, partial [Gammaproteobacteria bacterium]
MQGCRQMTLSHLKPLFQDMLENADVALLDAAGKAENNAAQALCFEAMQELKRKRREVEEAFLTGVDRGFRNMIAGAAPGEAETAAAPTAPLKLVLVEKHEIEVSLPVQNMTAKANATYSELLHGLNQRLAVVNGGRRLSE